MDAANTSNLPPHPVNQRGYDGELETNVAAPGQLLLAEPLTRTPAPRQRPMSSRRAGPYLQQQSYVIDDLGRMSTASFTAQGGSLRDSNQPGQVYIPYGSASRRRKKSMLSFSRSRENENPSDALKDNARQSESKEGPLSWIRRRMSPRSSERPPTPSRTSAVYHDQFYQGHPYMEDLSLFQRPDLVPTPSHVYEPRRYNHDVTSGAAARAAAAAQNEILASMRELTLTDSKSHRDSESGIGIEAAARELHPPGADVPAIRKGR